MKGRHLGTEGAGDCATQTPEVDAAEVGGGFISAELGRRLEREKNEIQAYADRLAEGFPDGMLPKDVENLKNANDGMARDISRLKGERDSARGDRSSLLGLIADIRVAVGDGEGRLMQDELVSHCKSLRIKSEGFLWRKPGDAPKSGEFILGDFGWPWAAPAIWDKDKEVWKVASPHGGSGEGIETNTEDPSRLRGWMPLPEPDEWRKLHGSL